MTDPVVDLSRVRAAASEADPEALLGALRGKYAQHALQRVGATLLRLAWNSPEHRPVLHPAMTKLADELRERGDVGDALLAADLTTLGAGDTIQGTVLPIDLMELVDAASGHGDYPGGYLNLRTGEVMHAFMTDADMIGEDDAVDIDESEDDWLHVLFESHDGWNDMAEFATTITDPRIVAALDRALHGRKPFAHFRDEVHRADVSRDWYDFEEERQHGRLRHLLDQDHIHPV